MAAKNTRDVEFKLGRLGLIIFIAGMSCLLLLAFLGGILVGRDIEQTPETIARKGPAALWGKAVQLMGGKPAVVAVRPEAPPPVVEPAPQPGLTFYDTLTKKKGEQKPLQKHLPGETEAPPEPPPAETKASPAPAAPPPGKTGTAPAKPAIPAAPVVAETAPKAVKKAAPAEEAKKDAYLIQVCSHKERAKSEAVSKQLKTMGFQPTVIQVDLPAKGRWHRVILTGFESEQQAQKAVAKMKKKIGGLDCVIRPRR